MLRIASLLRLWVAAACCWALGAAAQAPEVTDARVYPVEEGLALDADFSFELTPRLADVLKNGVPLYFVVEFEMTRYRWYWFDETAASTQMQQRLSYHPLSRQYRLSSGPLQQNFASLEEALNVLRRVRKWIIVDRTTSFSDADYEAGVRLRLDTTLLPKPFQVSALMARDLHLETPWKRFVVRSPRQLPAPVESREPKGAEDR
ncbi:MAG: DUF4390 domain-containing protein [Betaproteobacteria bacterium]|nr:DUF4390 domain-containing protein [Betaproteobacteria bacterium]